MCFNRVREEALELRNKELTGKSKHAKPGLLYWRALKPRINAYFGKQPLPGMRWNTPVHDKCIDTANDDYHADGTPDQHFYNQLVRIVRKHEPTPQRVLQIALNLGQGTADGTITDEWSFHHFVKFC